MPPERPLKLLDIGCGEGRIAIFFARNGYEVTAFDLSPQGVEKAKRYADEIGVSIKVFQANLSEFRLEEKFDILFSTGVFHYIPEELRKEIFDNYKEFTNENGLNAYSVFVKKPFIPRAPDFEKAAQSWVSGEVFSYYHDWKMESCQEEIFDCNSSGILHKHAVNRMIAGKIFGDL
ncbi:MAG TPA: class I SAM-dependent methyltransferase [Phycisphaerales bacterium]|nr:class I SAM-dependent methyltransferase [Phycisphaerales bacterium]